MDDQVLSDIVTALSKKPELWEWIRKLDSGTGTYNEASSIAEMVGDEIVKQLGPYFSEEVLEAYLRAGHSFVSAVSEVAQQNLNDAARIGLKPMTTKYPKAKADKLALELSALEQDRVADEIKNAVPSLMMKMVDDIVRYNADFQAKAGLTPIIKRTWSGSYPSHDTKHTDWCHDLAGTYEYGKEPKNVYSRHKGCRCKVEYFPNKNAQGRITALAKGEVDRESVLWNTRPETLESRIKQMNKQK